MNRQSQPDQKHRRALLVLSLDKLASVLDLPGGVRVVGVQSDCAGYARGAGGVLLEIEGSGLPEISTNDGNPIVLSAVYHSKDRVRGRFKKWRVSARDIE